MILVDTSIWIDHLRSHDPVLAGILDRNEVSTHSMIIGELALGSLSNREEFLTLLADLPRSARASDDEVLAFIESEALWSQGLSLVDAHLLAAARLGPADRLWTRDKQLLRAATAVDLAWDGTST